MAEIAKRVRGEEAWSKRPTQGAAQADSRTGNSVSDGSSASSRWSLEDSVDRNPIQPRTAGAS